MKVEFIPAPSNIDLLPVIEQALPQLHARIGLLTTVQHEHKIKEVQDLLEKNGFQVTYFGRVLGCRVRKIKDVDTVLFVGTGEFHPQGIWIKSGMNVLIADPLTGKISHITAAKMERAEKRKQGSLMKFYDATNIGILVSTKPGQHFGIVKDLKNKFPNKHFYTFVSGTLDFNQLENFPFIHCWVNTACPRIYDDQFKFPTAMINLIDIPLRGEA